MTIALLVGYSKISVAILVFILDKSIAPMLDAWVPFLFFTSIELWTWSEIYHLALAFTVAWRGIQQILWIIFPRYDTVQVHNSHGLFLLTWWSTFYTLLYQHIHIPARLNHIIKFIVNFPPSSKWWTSIAPWNLRTLAIWCKAWHTLLNLFSRTEGFRINWIGNIASKLLQRLIPYLIPV